MYEEKIETRTKDIDGVRWRYSINGQGGCRTVVLHDCTTDRKEVVTPCEIDGNPVTELRGFMSVARSHRTDSLSLASSLQIESVTVSEGVGKISYCFDNNPWLKQIKLPNTVTALGDSGDGESFINCKNLTKVELPQTLEIVRSNWTFAGCESLQEFSLPKTVRSLGGAKENRDCWDPMFKWDGPCMFSESTWWRVQPDGLVVKDGCLLGYKGIAPAEVIVPEGVILVSVAAFQTSDRSGSDCSKVERIVFPKSVFHYGNTEGGKRITFESVLGRGLFALKEITIPSADKCAAEIRMPLDVFCMSEVAIRNGWTEIAPCYGHGVIVTLR